MQLKYNCKTLTELHTPYIDVLQRMLRHTLSLLILLLATLLFPWNFGTQVMWIPIFVFSYILSARTTHRKHRLSSVALRGPHRKYVSRFRLRVHWSVSSTGRGADDIENTASSIVACWTVFTELFSGNALIKSHYIAPFLKLFVSISLSMNHRSFFPVVPARGGFLRFGSSSCDDCSPTATTAPP
jgi:hypothetical protein